MLNFSLPFLRLARALRAICRAAPKIRGIGGEVWAESAGNFDHAPRFNGHFLVTAVSAGPRSGSSFALQEATIVLATLVQRFDMRLLPGARAWHVQKITLRPAHGLPMQIVQRCCV